MLKATTHWTQQSLLAEAIRVLDEAGTENARRNAEWMLQEALQCRRAQLYAHPERSVSPEQVEAVRQMLERRRRREPLQYILGYTEFYGLRMQVTPDVLIPRPETEQIVETALDLIASTPTPRVLDVGTGSGCIPVAIKHERPEAKVYACDVSRAALDVARSNAAYHYVDITFVRLDVLEPEAARHVAGPFDLIVSNPPYVTPEEADTLAPEVREHEPHVALFTDGDPLRFFRAVIRLASDALAPDGGLVFEANEAYAHDVRDLLRRRGYTDVRVKRDLAGKPRIVSAQQSATSILF